MALELRLCVNNTQIIEYHGHHASLQPANTSLDQASQ